MTPLFSIVVPYFNAVAFLTDAVESVKCQSFADWELLLIDDGSTDTGPDIADDLADKDARLRRFRHAANKGVAAARNYGLREARGDYVAFLDADDFYYPEKLEREARLLEQFPSLTALFSPTDWSDAAGDIIKQERAGLPPDSMVEPPDALRALLLEHRGDVPCICSFTIRRDIALSLGGFEEPFALYEDQTLLAKVLAKHPTFGSSKPGAVYRQHAGSVSARANAAGLYIPGAKHAAEEAFLRWLKAYLDREGVSEPALDHVLASRLGMYAPHWPTRFASSGMVRLRNLRIRVGHARDDLRKRVGGSAGQRPCP